MKIPRDVSGRELIKVLCRDYGYRQISQEGSHVILTTDHPSPQRIAVPDHRAIRVDTLNAILRAVARHKGIEREEIIHAL